MKDATHHLKHVQRKVVRSVRQSESERYVNPNHNNGVDILDSLVPNRIKKRKLSTSR